MSTILKALRRLEEDDAKSRDANASGEGRLVSESTEPKAGLPDSAYAAADSLANAASPRAEIPAEAQQEGITFDRALSLARSRAVLAVATAVGLIALTFGAISLRNSGGFQLTSEPTLDTASSAAVRPSPSAPAPAARPSVPGAAAAEAAIAVVVPTAEVSPTALARAQSAENSVAGSSNSAASQSAILDASPRSGSTLAASVPSAASAAAPGNAEATPMRSQSAAPKVAKPLRSAPKPARTAAAPVVAAAVSPTRAAAAGAAATAEKKIAQATQSLADRPVSRRPRAERLSTPAPVSSADTDESIPLAEMLPMTSASPSPSPLVTPPQTTRAPIPKAPARQFDSDAPTPRPADRLSPLAQARAMESAAAAAAASSASRPSPRASAVTPEPARASMATRAQTTGATIAPSAAQPDRDVERVDRRGLPDVRVVRTSWHPQPDRRSAQVRVDASSEMLTLREGDAVGGLVVQSISPSSVLFESGGIEIRRRVGAGR